MYIKTPATDDWGRHEYQRGRHTRLYFTDRIYKDVTSMIYKVGISIGLVVHVIIILWGLAHQERTRVYKNIIDRI